MPEGVYTVNIDGTGLDDVGDLPDHAFRPSATCANRWYFRWLPAECHTVEAGSGAEARRLANGLWTFSTTSGDGTHLSRRKLGAQTDDLSRSTTSR